MEIRAATNADVAGVLALWRAARTQHAATPDTPESVERALGSLLLAEDGGELVGALIAAWDGWRGNLYRLAVAEHRRREGIAQALVRAGEKRLRELGAQRVTALVAREDDAARAFWTAAGYPPDPLIGRHVRNL